jgi:hypothetical protein
MSEVNGDLSATFLQRSNQIVAHGNSYRLSVNNLTDVLADLTDINGSDQLEVWAA